MSIINIQNSLQAGIQSAIADTWRQKFPVYRDAQAFLLHSLPNTNIRSASYGFKDVVPFPRPWGYNAARVRQVFQDRLITIGVYPYEMTTIWNLFDAEDDQLGVGDIKKTVSMGVERYFQIPDILYTEYLTGVADYNEAINNAFDGVALFSTVDGDGNARFSVTGGNILSGQASASHADIKQAIMLVRKRFLDMQEIGTGQPLHQPRDVMYNRMRYVIPSDLDALFNGIQEQDLIYTDTAINTAQSNLLKGKIRYDVNQRLTVATTWYVVLEHPFWKPFAYRSPKDMQQFYGDLTNSDEAREMHRNIAYSHVRVGIGPWCPFTIIKVTA